MQAITGQQLVDAFGGSGKQKVTSADRRPCFECLNLLMRRHGNLCQMSRLPKFVIDVKAQMKTQLVLIQVFPSTIKRCDVSDNCAGCETLCLRPWQLLCAQRGLSGSVCEVQTNCKARWPKVFPDDHHALNLVMDFARMCTHGNDIALEQATVGLYENNRLTWRLISQF